MRDGLCTECGFCVPICPTDAIDLQEDRHGELLPRVNVETCVMCPLCLAVCPGETVDFDKYYREYLGSDEYRKYFGHVRSTHIGYTTDDDLRLRAASGGITTRLAQFALESGELDWLVFARAREDDPFRSETVITNDPADLERAPGSLYFPVPLGESMDLLLEREIPRDARLGMIGLPCHLHAAHRLTDTGKYKKYGWHLLFGIFCGGTWTYKATDTFLGVLGERRDDVRRFAYRGEGWPGQISLETRDGREIRYGRHTGTLAEKLNFKTIFKAYSYYAPHRCLTCSDGVAELADIAFGDPWLKSEKGDKVGKTLVVCRTERAERLLEKAVEAGVMTTSPLDPELMVVSQKGMLTFKQNWAAFSWFARKVRGWKTPRYNYRWQDEERVPPILYVYAGVSYACHVIGRRLPWAWVRIGLTFVQGVTAQIVKRFAVRLTDRDHESYFS